MSKLTAAIVGPGNIGTDLMYKLLRSEVIEPRWMIGVDPSSEGLKLAAAKGLESTHEGVDWLLKQDELPDLIFEATSAYVHREYAPRYEEAGIRAVDLTPAAVGPAVIPPVNGTEHVGAWNVNMITCGGQATIPMVAAVSRAAGPEGVSYAEIVASVSSMSAGPGTRANIDEFTRTTANGVETIGGARRGKAIIILNPAEPPMIMRDTIFCAVSPDADRDAIVASVFAMEKAVQEYVPGYRLLQEPQIDEPSAATQGQVKVSVFVEVEGAGDFLPPYAGNLDIMTAAAAQVGDNIARSLLAGKA
jgi:acetaldehyde dehydrogenase